MLMALYSAALALAVLIASPWWLLRMFTTERYREGLRERLGRVPARLREAAARRRVVWVHAVSVGEVLAASRLVAELETALNAYAGADSETWRVVVSTTTRTGQALARERFGAERVFYFPLDFAWAVRAYLHALSPSVLVLMESELWPRVVHECRRAGVPVAVVNARVSDRSFARGTKLRVLWGRALRMVSLWLAQSDEDARRLMAMGARAGSVRAIGNLKYDVRAPKQSRVAELIKEAAAGRPVIVAGSTHAGPKFAEEEVLLAGMREVWKEFPDAVLVLAPRHPERFDEVERLSSAYGPIVRVSGLLQDQTSAPTGKKILLLDTIGDLALVYGIADVAFVGGSLVERGGHNPLEPAQFGVPVLMGPSVENFRDIAGKMKEAHALLRVDPGPAFHKIVADLLSHRERAVETGERGRRVFEAQQGATARSVNAIMELMGLGQGATR